MSWDRKRLLEYVEIIQLILGVTDKYEIYSLQYSHDEIQKKKVKRIRRKLFPLSILCLCMVRLHECYSLLSYAYAIGIKISILFYNVGLFRVPASETRIIMQEINGSCVCCFIC